MATTHVAVGSVELPLPSAPDQIRLQVAALDLVADERDPGTAQLVAVAPSQLQTSFSNLPWLVAVSQPEAALFAPIRTQATSLLLLLALTALLVLALDAWFSFHLTAPLEEEEVAIHLVEHPETPRLEEEEAEA